METSYLRGFFDRQCSISDHAITLTTNQVDLGAQVGSSLRLLKISCRISTKGGRVKIRIASKAALRQFRDLIGFEDSGKRVKLNELIDGPLPTA